MADRTSARDVLPARPGSREVAACLPWLDLLRPPPRWPGPVAPTFHPASILRAPSPDERRAALERLVDGLRAARALREAPDEASVRQEAP